MLGFVEVIRSRHPRLGGRKLLHLITPMAEAEGVKMGRDTFFDLLSEHGLQVRRRRRTAPRTTDSRFWRKQYPDLLKDRDSADASPIWVSDITYLRLQTGFVYLALTTDLTTRRVVGYHLSTSMHTHKLCLPALQMALNNVPENMRQNLIHHSDRGSQYLDAAFVRLIEKSGGRMSMTQSGDPRDNAVAERLNGILKQEYFPVQFANFSHAHRLVEHGIKLYNTERPHLSLLLETPKQTWNNLQESLALEKRKESSQDQSLQEYSFVTPTQD
jgi:transposase InsO family protein